MRLKKLLFIIFAVFLISNFNNDLHANQNIPGWEFYPQGYNYLCRDYFLYYESTHVGTLESQTFLKVKPNTDYTFSIYDDAHFLLQSLEVHFFNSNKKLIEIKNINVDDGQKVNFMTNNMVAYIKMKIDFYFGMNYSDYSNVDQYFCLFETDKIDSPFDKSIMNYLGPDIVYDVIDRDEDIYFIKNFDDFYSIDDILAYIYAYDDCDGDLSNEIKIEYDNYTARHNSVGTWDVYLSISDRAKNRASVKLYITNLDLVPPIIKGQAYYEISPSQCLDLDVIKQNLTATDNYDGECSESIIVDYDNYTDNYNQEGEYEIIFSATDSSGNEGFFTVTVKVIDNESPTFSGPQRIKKYKSETLDVLDVQKHIKAYDNVDGDITNQIFIAIDDYSANSHRYGEWEIMFMVQDEAGNMATYSVIIEVIDDVAPIFLIDKTSINLETHNSNLSLDDIIDILVRTNHLPSRDNVTVLLDEYTKNFYKSGNFLVVLQNEENEIEVMINVTEEEVAAPDLQTKESIFKKIWHFLKNIFFRLINFLKRIFT